MKAIDSIIESSKSENELQENLVKINKALHGSGVTNSAIDMASSPEELTEAMVSLARKKRVTKEDQSEILQTIYNTIRQAGIFSKPADYILTPFTEAARAPFKLATIIGDNKSQTPDIDIAGSWRNPTELSPTFGFSAFITDLSNAMGIQQGPIANLNETEFAAEYPVAANILTEMTNPANLAAMGLEGFLGAKLPGAINQPINAKTIAKMQDAVSGWYLSAIQKDSGLTQALKESGKWNDVVRYFSENKKNLITPMNKGKAIDFLEGPVGSSEDFINNDLRSRRLTGRGEISRLGDEQENILNKIPSATHTVNPIELRQSAYESLSPDITGDQRSRAMQLIDETIPYYDYDQNKISALQKVADSDAEFNRLNSEISSEQSLIEDMLQRKKIEESLRLSGEPSSIPNPQYREDLQWLSKLPVVEGDDIFPKVRSEYVTDITYPDDPQYLGKFGAGPRQDQKITSVEESFRSASPTIGQNQKLLDIAMGKQNNSPLIDNPNYYAIKADVDNKILLLNNEIESVRRLNMAKPENYNKLSKLMKERDALNSFVNLNIDPTFSFSPNPVESYKQYIFNMNQMPAGAGTSVRRRGNKFIDGAKMNALDLDAGAKQAAGKALARAGGEAEQTALGYLDHVGDINEFNRLKRQQELALKSRDLITGNMSNKPSLSGTVPVGDMIRGAFREIINFGPEYVGPYSMDALNWMNNQGQQVARGVAPLLPVGNTSNMAQPAQQAPSDFIPRGIPLQDPMMKSHAIDAIGRDKQNTPARNAERMMKIINEGIFED